ncbi:RNA-binding protein 44 isoform 2-T2 [Polymixia lowei]
MKSSGRTARKDCLAEGGCACTQRAQRAELCLLALQYSMCKQHFWRHYYTSPEGERFTLMQGDINWPEGPPANLLGVMQRLQSDYEEMRDKILAGEPLEQLKPLSVSSQVITTGSHYIPAQIIGDTLGNVTIGSSQQLDRQDGEEGYGGHGGPQGQNTKAPQSISLNRATATQGRTDPASQPKVDINKARKAVSLLPRKNDTSCGHRPAEKQTASPFKELDTNDTWYDAEEDLQPEQPAAEMGEASSVMTKGSAREAKSTSSVLCVSDLPRNVTEGDVMKLFEKSLASEVSITTFSNDLRVATVMVSDPQSAEVAVREMNGCSMQTNNPRTGSQSQAQQQAASLTSKPGSSGDARKPQTSKTNSSNTTKNQPVGLSLEKQKVLCVLPTAKGTCVPQHYATMGSFGTLMAQLTERHPEVDRQRIVDALLELRANHKGVLSGLPLRAIMEMTSELLTKPVGPMQS